jgi:hypothetical protein
MVIDVSKQYFPKMAVGFSDPRVSVHVCDGIKFVQEAAEGTYDVIVVDSSDPVGPAEVLFQKVCIVCREGGGLLQGTAPEALWTSNGSVAHRAQLHGMRAHGTYAPNTLAARISLFTLPHAPCRTPTPCSPSLSTCTAH